MKKQLYRAAAATVLGLSLTTGIVAADTGNIGGSGSIRNTGPDSSNRITTRVHNSAHIRNDNDVHVTNKNDQSAYTGKAVVAHNNRGGDATSGDATNSNDTDVKVKIDNTGTTDNLLNPTSFSSDPGGGSIRNTGPDSSNKISTNVSNRLSVNNDNDVSVYNTNDQHASSGDAVVAGNTKGGDATSGDAKNTNSSTFTIDISN